MKIKRCYKSCLNFVYEYIKILLINPIWVYENIEILLDLFKFCVWIHTDIIKQIHIASAVWLVGWILWHLNLFRLFNAKSISYK